MCESLKLHQGPGLNGMFLTADPLSQEYDAQSNVTKYTLRPDYTLYTVCLLICNSLAISH